MSNDYDQHIILHHLDDPLRIFKWTVDEALCLILPPFIGLGLEQPLLGVSAAGVGFWGLRQIKKRYGLSTLRHALYWYLPHNTRKLKNTPPSYIREYLG